MSKLQFYKSPVFVNTQALQMFKVISKLYIWQSLYAIWYRCFRVEIVWHRLNPWNGKFQFAFLFEMSKHILICKRKPDTFLLWKICDIILYRWKIYKISSVRPLTTVQVNWEIVTSMCLGAQAVKKCWFTDFMYGWIWFY